jgi:hypothetical protein
VARRASAARRRSPLRVLVGTCCAALVLASCQPSQDSSARSTPTSLAPPAHDSLRLTLDRLGTAVSVGDRVGVARLATGSARRSVRAAALNGRLLPLDSVVFRLVARSGLGAAVVRVRWRLRGVPASSLVDIEFARRAGATVVTDIGGAGRAVPVWLTSPLRARIAGDALVVMARGRPDLGLPDAGPSGLVRAVRLATQDVRRVLPLWREPWLVVAPGTAGHYDDVLGASSGEYAAVAAVTSTIDGSGHPGSPVQVVLNPTVFGTMTAGGARVVLAHEAAHVALGAASSTMPLWLVEGFADYVALLHSATPDRETLAALIGEVRRSGAPATLPGTREFAGRGSRLQAAYESAWLACHLLVQRGGERKLVAFYRAVERGESAAAELKRRYGLSRAELTAAVRAEVSHWTE